MANLLILLYHLPDLPNIGLVTFHIRFSHRIHYWHGARLFVNKDCLPLQRGVIPTGRADMAIAPEIKVGPRLYPRYGIKVFKAFLLQHDGIVADVIHT